MEIGDRVKTPNDGHGVVIKTHPNGEVQLALENGRKLAIAGAKCIKVTHPGAAPAATPAPPATPGE